MLVLKDHIFKSFIYRWPRLAYLEMGNGKIKKKGGGGEWYGSVGLNVGGFITA